MPEELGARYGHLVEVPPENAKGFVVVPKEVDMETYTPVKAPPVEELTTSYYVQGIQTILGARPDQIARDEATQEQSENSDAPPDPNVFDDNEDMPTDDLENLIRHGLRGEREFGPGSAFRNTSDFQKHRGHVSAEYDRMSQDLELPKPIEVCCVESCVSNATPCSKFCFVHYGLDPGFSSQNLFTRCHHVEEGQRCCIPCDRSHRFCTLHGTRHGNPLVPA
jgi:hypothetical protein